jgi:hypothetical protein
MKPVELLEKELDKYLLARDRSSSAYEQNLIGWSLHMEHIKNLNPIITEYKRAIRILRDNTE